MSDSHDDNSHNGNDDFVRRPLVTVSARTSRRNLVAGGAVLAVAIGNFFVGVRKAHARPPTCLLTGTRILTPKGEAAEAPAKRIVRAAKMVPRMVGVL